MILLEIVFTLAGGGSAVGRQAEVLSARVNAIRGRINSDASNPLVIGFSVPV